VLYHAIILPYVLIARFRVKKKVKTLNLERTVSDLSGRVDELEQEASDLRRENSWLKEIVVLKSNRVRGGDPQAGPSRLQGSRKDIDDSVDEESNPDDSGRGE
jgi:Basic region leucine zipper